MREIFYLTKRNCLVYLRDKSAVFFSLLSMLIVLGLMVVFLGKMNSENVLSVIEEYGGRKITAQDRENAAYLIQMWTLAGNYISKCGDSYNDSAWKYGAGRDEKEDYGFLCDTGKKALSGAGIYFLRLGYRNFYVSSNICNGRGILFPERV